MKKLIKISIIIISIISCKDVVVEEIKNNSNSRIINYSEINLEAVYKINLYSKINRVKLTNSIYFNQRLFDGKLPIASGGIIDLKRSFWGYNVNSTINP